MPYYQLRCVTCDVVCKPVLATSPGELLYPEYGESAACPYCGQRCSCAGGRGSLLMDQLKGFHATLEVIG